MPLFALAIAAFAIGTTEFVVMGLLPEVAADLQVSLPDAGLLITGYALGVVFGGPVLAILTSTLARKRALMGLIAVFVFGNALCALAPSYGLLMAARVLAALSHGAFFGTATLVAARVAPAGQSARAMSLVFSGLTVANIVGVPLGTFVGQQLGWRATFWGIAVLGIAALLATLRWVPEVETARGDSMAGELRTLLRPQVWLAAAMTVFGFGGVFTVFTFIVPILEQQAGIGATAVSPVLTLFGLGATCGVLLGGRLADWKLMPALLAVLLSLILLFVAFAWAMHSAPTAIAGVFLIGFVGFATGPALQSWSMQQASDAPLMASTLNQSAFNLGNAGGAFLGASLLRAGDSYSTLSFAAAGVTLIGLVLTLTARGLQASAPIGIELSQHP